ncbi:hypothetical protein HPB48_010270 [Haemaphysalis longicornis]|uniref:Holocytochrome c-type synthase n=1 Tax=Haemaphysalis longicornis TaxID=44386 RepID=A0A9J6FUX9_HAELO|nr:hypothetical protein HPB48_010270 [Haemaphysalis longicornis]
MGLSASQPREVTGPLGTVMVHTRSEPPSEQQQQPPSECPMHGACKEITGEPPKGHPPVQKAYASECPMSAAATNKEEINPANMVSRALSMGSAEHNAEPQPAARAGPAVSAADGATALAHPQGRRGGGETWEYPSQQMFWNAMLRKGWRWRESELQPEDMAHIIRIHNANNDHAWEEVLKECCTPSLKKFGGKATDYSPRARIRSWLGYELPFDRHDWIVDRCGKEVRYVIDYYDGGAVDETSARFALLDVRPAFDSFENIWDRMKVAWWRWTVARERESGSEPASSQQSGASSQ